MIFDQLQHADFYNLLGERFIKGFAFLRRQDLADLKPGRYDIDGQEVYATVMELDLKPAAQGVWEAHRRYADIQYVISGKERMDIAEISALKTSTPYDPDGDAELFTGTGQSLIVPAGSFTVFLPQDGHKPGLRPSAGPAKVKKAVVKVLCHDLRR